MSAERYDHAALVRGWLHEPVELSPLDMGRIERRVGQTAQRSHWLPPIFTGRLQPMFSATKFVVASVIVTLFGGFLLAGVMTTPQDDQTLPAIAATPSASATNTPIAESTDAAQTDRPEIVTASDLLPGTTLTVEEVESGVLRVVSDGVRELSRTTGMTRKHRLLTGGDGSVWLIETDRITRLGTDNILRKERIRGDRVQVSGDGTAWLLVDGSHRQTPGLFSNSGNGWRRRLGDGVESFRAISDGSVWVLRPSGPNGESQEIVRLGRSSESKPQVLTEVPGRRPEIGDWGVTDDRTVWVKRGWSISRYDGKGWETVKRREGGLDVTPDGRVYIRTDLGDGPVALRLLDDGEWSAPPPPLPIGPTEPVFRSAVTAVAPDGSYWRSVEAVVGCRGSASCRLQESWFPEGVPPGMSSAGACGGLARYDGTAWRRYLEGQCVIEIDFDTRGNAWVRAKTPTLGGTVRTATDVDVTGLSFDRVDIYIISP